MKIKYEFVNGDVSEIEVDVPAKITDFYLQSLEQEKSNDRKNSRPDRHTSLEQFNYEDAKYFSFPNDFPDEIISDLEVEHMLSVLNENQKFLVRKCVLEGTSYTEMAQRIGKDESAVRHAVERALKKIKKSFT